MRVWGTWAHVYCTLLPLHLYTFVELLNIALAELYALLLLRCMWCSPDDLKWALVAARVVPGIFGRC